MTDTNNGGGEAWRHRADLKIVADTMQEMQREIERLTGARHSMYDGAIGIARGLALHPHPSQQAGTEGLAKALFDDGFRDLPEMTWDQAGAAHQAVYMAQAERILAALSPKTGEG
jgi:hypothetical protein